MMSTLGFYLVIIGAINWGLVGIGHFLNMELNVVHLLFGNWAWLPALIYIIVGICGVMLLFGCKCDKCKMPTAGDGQPAI